MLLQNGSYGDTAKYLSVWLALPSVICAFRLKGGIIASYPSFFHSKAVLQNIFTTFFTLKGSSLNFSMHNFSLLAQFLLLCPDSFTCVGTGLLIACIARRLWYKAHTTEDGHALNFQNVFKSLLQLQLQLQEIPSSLNCSMK